MSDEITEYVARKLTKGQKRPGGNASEMQHDRKHVDLVAPRTPEELRAAQSQLAVMAAEHPALRSAAERELWLEEVLEALGLRRRIAARPPGSTEQCFPHTGTVRGYNIHLRGYTVPCTKCKNVGDELEAARLSALGLEVKEERWLLTKS